MKDKLKWFVVYVDESAGWDAFECFVPHIVAASNEEEARNLFEKSSWDDPWKVEEWKDLPSLLRKKKAFIWL